MSDASPGVQHRQRSPASNATLLTDSMEDEKNSKMKMKSIFWLWSAFAALKAIRTEATDLKIAWLLQLFKNRLRTIG